MSGFLRVEALWAIPVVVLVAILLDRFGWLKTFRTLVRMGQENMAPRLGSLRLQALAAFLAAAALALVALAGPYHLGTTYHQRLRAVIVFDVSRSMAAKDYSEPLPTRFERAKDAVIQVLRRWPESEVALVVFAGEAFVWIPRMRDMRALEWIISNWIEIGMAPEEGSNLASGLQAALEVLFATHEPKEGENTGRYWRDPGTGRVNYWRDPKTGKVSAAVIVFSDGVPDELPADALAAYQREGVKIVVGGVGQPRDITVTLPNGKTYNVPLGEPMLKAVAEATGGEYSRIATGGEVADIVARHQEFFAAVETDAVERDLYQWPLAASFLFAVLWILRMTRR